MKMSSPTRSLAAGVIIGLFIGLILGYAMTSMGTDISKFEQQISQLEKQVKDLRSQLKSKDAQISNLQNQLISKNTQISDLQSQIEDLKALVPPLRKGKWNAIITFTGSTSKTTELFHIPSGKWRINWTYTGGQFAAFGFLVYQEGEKTMPVETLLTTGPSRSDATYIYKGPGNFYIKVSVANIEEWTLTIEAFVPE